MNALTSSYTALNVYPSASPIWNSDNYFNWSLNTKTLRTIIQGLNNITGLQ